MSDRMSVTRTAEITAGEKGPKPVEDGAFFDHAWIGPPETVRAWMRGDGAAYDVLGPWVGSPAASDPVRAVVVVRARSALTPPRDMELADAAFARGVVGVFAGR